MVDMNNFLIFSQNSDAKNLNYIFIKHLNLRKCNVNLKNIKTILNKNILKFFKNMRFIISKIK